MSRLLIVTTVPYTIRVFLLPFAHHFRARGWRVDAAAADLSEAADCIAAFDRCWDIPWSRRTIENLNLVSSLRVVRELVRAERYDIVHVHTPIAAFLTRLALHQTRGKGSARVVYTAHGFHFFPGGSWIGNLSFRKIEALAARWTDRIVVMNQHDERAAREQLGYRDEQVISMPGIGLDVASLRATADNADTPALRGGLRLSKGDKLLLIPAELNQGKRHRDLLQALAALNDDSLHLAVAGEGPLRESLEALARQLDIASRVHFLGFREGIAGWLKAADAVVLPSEREGLPRSIMEAMAVGTPVIAAVARGSEDLLAEGRGLLVPVGDPVALAAAIRTALSGGAEIDAMVERARQYMPRFERSAILARHEQLYEELVGEQAIS